MTAEEARHEAVVRYMDKADKARTAARRELEARDLDLAVNRIDYTCFYAVRAVLLQSEKVFARHSGVGAGWPQHRVKPGKLAVEFAKFYDEAFEARQEADYGASTSIEAGLVLERIGTAERFVADMRRLLRSA